MEESKGSLSKPAAVIACISMTLFYVATLYAPTTILRLPPSTSTILQGFHDRWFIWAAVSSVASVIFCAFLLPIRSVEASYLFGVYGIRSDHHWQAVVFPLFLTSLIYAGSLVLDSMLLVNKWKKRKNQDKRPLFCCIKSTLLRFPSQMSLVASNVLFWRNFVVVGNLVASLVAHAFCNYMGLPLLFVQRKGLVSVEFMAGMLSFAWLLFPITRPDDRTNNCRSWQGYCLWN